MFAPDFFYDSVYDVNYEMLRELGIRGLIFDIDNTLAAFDEALPPEETVQLIARLQTMGFSLCLLTNNSEGRLRQFNQDLGLPGFAGALKPLPFGVRKAAGAMGTSLEETAIIGDQLFSDVWAGRNCGIRAIMVSPISQRDFWFVKIKRLIEKRMLRGFFANKCRE